MRGVPWRRRRNELARTELARNELGGPAGDPRFAIEVRGLTHAYDHTRVLDHVDLRVAAGTVHGFVGPNGAGKTTTLDVIATLLVPQRGEVRVLGMDVRRDPKRARRKVGYMPEHFSMYRQLTCFEYLDFFAAAHGQKLIVRDERIAAVVETTGIGSFLHRGIDTLSRGMQQRVCLARVLLHDPRVLLLDEPASGLDPRARTELLAVVRRLAQSGRTVLMSSHILGELADCCDAVTVLDRGTVRFSGPLRELYAEDRGGRRRFVVTLRGTPPEAAAIARGVDGVAGAELDGARLAVDVAVDIAAGDPIGDPIGRVLTALLDHGCRVEAVAAEQRGLDAAFLELTGEGA